MNIQNRYDRICALRIVKAPKWIIKNEQVELVALKYQLDDNKIQALLDKYVRPLMDGKGYITVPDYE